MTQMLLRSTKPAAALLALLCLVCGAKAQTADGSAVPVPGATNRPLHVCASCHGDGGKSTAEIFPSLAGQQKDYIAAQLTAFRDHTRQDRDAKSYMWGMAAGSSDAMIAELAAYYASQPPAAGAALPPSATAMGEAIYARGVPERGVPACAACHGAGAEGNAAFPRLAGQHKDYLFVQLEAFASGARDNAAMNLIAKKLKQKDMNAVAAYLSSL